MPLQNMAHGFSYPITKPSRDSSLIKNISRRVNYNLNFKPGAYNLATWCSFFSSHQASQTRANKRSFLHKKSMTTHCWFLFVLPRKLTKRVYAIIKRPFICIGVSCSLHIAIRIIRVSFKRFSRSRNFNKINNIILRYISNLFLLL